MTFSAEAPLPLFLFVVSCDQSTTNDNNDSQEPSIKYTQTTAKRGNIDIKQVLNLDASTIATRRKAYDYLINNKKWVINYIDDLCSGETQFLNLNIFF